MKLSLDKIREITCGAVTVEETDGVFRFYRFTEEQRETYKRIKPDRVDFYNKCLATAGVKLRFTTDSRTLSLKIFTPEENKGSSRKYFAFDVVVNGEKIDSLSNFTDSQMTDNYTGTVLESGNFGKIFDLGQGEKSVCVYFPFSIAPDITEIGIDDGAFIKPVKSPKKMICFGDSITHGYDALHPSAMYTAKLALALSAEEYNKGIGGDIFFPELAAVRDGFDPDYITVAYGTNDWSGCPRNATRDRIKRFFENLRENYPAAKIFAITPIWRAESVEERNYGEFSLVGQDIKEICGDIGGITVIDGFNLVPHDPNCFGDLRLHPNDKGFEHYFKNLYSEIKKHI